MDKKFYITTPIYYPSAKPHMGHAYSSIIADVFARFKRLEGKNVYFLTGTDEHGLKIQREAKKNNKDTKKFCDELSLKFKELTNTLNLSNDDFYLSKYSGWYSVSDEAFYNEDEIEDLDGVKRSISSKSPVEWIEEESYFCLLYTSPSPRDGLLSRMPSSA